MASAADNRLPADLASGLVVFGVRCNHSQPQYIAEPSEHGPPRTVQTRSTVIVDLDRTIKSEVLLDVKAACNTTYRSHP